MNPRNSRSDLRPGEPSAKSATSIGRSARLAIAAAFSVVVALAAVLRFQCSLGDFWLDEIWSLFLSLQLQSPLDAITSLHHDNNHYFNTWILYLIGGDAPTYVYRLPAVIAGVGTVLLCARIARSWNRAAMTAATLLTGFSFLLIQYSSEARGYAYLQFFAAASWAVMRQSAERPRAVWDVLFACVAVLGFFSHLTYLFGYVALMTWSLRQGTFDYERPARRRFVSVVFQVLIPVGFILLLYVVDLRHIRVGGGDESSLSAAIVQATSAAFGGPLEGPGAIVVAMAILAIAIVALLLLYRTGSDLWVPFCTGIFLVPAVVVLVVRPEWPYPRYFLVCMLFLQLLASWLLGWIYGRPLGKAAYVVILTAIVGGNAMLTAPLLKYGRGNYDAAVRYMLKHALGRQVTVGGDHDFRNQLVLSFYCSRLPGGDRVQYVDQYHWPAEGPEWVLLHDSHQQYIPDKSMEDERNNVYELAGAFPFAGLSGFHWALYRNTNGRAGPPP